MNLKYRRTQWLESNRDNRCLIGLVISTGNGNELHLRAICKTCGLFTMNKESLSEEKCVKRFQIHQYFWGFTKYGDLMCQMAVVLEWVVVISLGTCTQRWILIKFKGSFTFSLEHLGCLWHLISLWKSTKCWPRMSPKKILVRMSIIFLTQHIVQL